MNSERIHPYVLWNHDLVKHNIEIEVNFPWLSIFTKNAETESFACSCGQEANENFEDASNELILTDEEVVRFQIGEIFAHVPKDEVERRIEQMQETTTKHLEKLKEEKESIVSQMAELKKILYGKFKDSINLEEDWL